MESGDGVRHRCIPSQKPCRTGQTLHALVVQVMITTIESSTEVIATSKDR